VRRIVAKVATTHNPWRGAGEEKVFLFHGSNQENAFTSFTWQQAADAHAALGDVLAKRALTS